MAEAVLTLDNADGSLPIEFGEVSIGRRAYRSGESEYLINGARARLRDIVDLLGEGQLGANALVVVGQGTVDAALSLRPEERRQLFEDAAGVKSLQVRKNEALSRLARSRDNLVRVADLVGELKPQVRRLVAPGAAPAGARLARDAGAGDGHRARIAVARRRCAPCWARRGGPPAAAEASLEAHRASQAAGRAEVERAEASYWEAEAEARAAGERRSETREALVRAEGRLESLIARARELEDAIRRDERSAWSKRAPRSRELTDAERASRRRSRRRSRRHARPRSAGARPIAALAAADATLLEAEERLSAARALDADRLAASARATERQAAAAERVRRIAVGSRERQRSRCARQRTALEPASALATRRVAETEQARTTLQQAERDAEDAVRAAPTRPSGAPASWSDERGPWRRS